MAFDGLSRIPFLGLAVASLLLPSPAWAGWPASPTAGYWIPADVYCPSGPLTSQVLGKTTSVTAIRDQGPCSASFAYAVVGMAECAYKGQTGDDRPLSTLDLLLSAPGLPQLCCERDAQVNGAILGALTYVTETGLLPHAACPDALYSPECAVNPGCHQQTCVGTPADPFCLSCDVPSFTDACGHECTGAYSTDPLAQGPFQHPAATVVANAVDSYQPSAPMVGKKCFPGYSDRLRIPRFDKNDQESKLKQWISEKRPVAIELRLDDPAGFFDKGELCYELDSLGECNGQGAVSVWLTIVAYAEAGGQVSSYLLRGSFGQGWGCQGYLAVTRDALFGSSGCAAGGKTLGYAFPGTLNGLPLYEDTPEESRNLAFWTDPDGDGVQTAACQGPILQWCGDNCKDVPNPAQENHDDDPYGDACDQDDDDDGILDDGDGSGQIGDNPCQHDNTDFCDDNCQFKPNAQQKDSDSDGVGDKCAKDSDDDGDPDGHDCAELDPTAYYGAPEVCDGKLQDCAGKVDEGFVDTDKDLIADCVDPDDDQDGIPDASDNCTLIANVDQKDTDQDGTGDTCEMDRDGDGDPDNIDCDPENKDIHHGVVEARTLCDGRDNNCNHVVDEACNDADKDGIADVVDPDADGDGVPSDVDCDDANKKMYPATENQAAYEEKCDTFDNDCDGHKDLVPAADGSGNWVTVCTVANPVDKDGDGFKSDVDCNDSTTSGAATYPGAPEKCDGRDNDCDGLYDEACPDTDKDGKFDYFPGVTIDPKYLDYDSDNDKYPNESDCAVYDPMVHPDAIELCDGVDNNCNEVKDEIFPNADGDPWPDCIDPDDDDDNVPDEGNTIIGYQPCQGGKDGNKHCDDNCPFLANTDQANFDGDQYGDACDKDKDNDGVLDQDVPFPDNCPFLSNPPVVPGDPQGNLDMELAATGWCDEMPDGTDLCDPDGDGDACDPDDDGDGVDDPLDSCPRLPNPGQYDADRDGAGDLCDDDDDDDGVGDTLDNCRFVANPYQDDLDSDGLGDACDRDRDGDCVAEDCQAVLDEMADPFCSGGFTGCDDDCPGVYNPEQADGGVRLGVAYPSNGVGDDCDTDFDGDQLPNPVDPCPGVPGTAADLDGDGRGDDCDVDADGDLVPDAVDNCQRLANPDQLNSDSDDSGDACDEDDDNDGTPDVHDLCPLLRPAPMPTGSGATMGEAGSSLKGAHQDDDGDGLGNECDWDMDDDGLPNAFEDTIGTDPHQADSDGDGFTDWQEFSNRGAGNSPQPTDPLRAEDYPGHRRPAAAVFSGGGSAGSCAVGGRGSPAGSPASGAWGLLAAALGLLIAHRARKPWLVLLALAWLPRPGDANPLTPHLTLPTVGPFLHLQSGLPGADGERRLIALTYEFAKSPLSVERLGGQTDTVIRSQGLMRLSAVLPVLEPKALEGRATHAAALVLQVGWTMHRSTPELFSELGQGGVEDVLLALPVTVVMQRRSARHGIVVEPYLTLPNGEATRFTGKGRGAAGFVAGYEVEGTFFRLGTNLGFEYQPDDPFLPRSMVLARYGLGAAVQVAARTLSVGAEYDGALTFGRYSDLSSIYGVLQFELDHFQTKLAAGTDFDGFLGDSPFRLVATLGLLF
jgi:hypothetical protein